MSIAPEGRYVERKFHCLNFKSSVGATQARHNASTNQRINNFLCRSYEAFGLCGFCASIDMSLLRSWIHNHKLITVSHDNIEGIEPHRGGMSIAQRGDMSIEKYHRLDFQSSVGAAHA